jgi:hypothetical protein
VVQTAVRSSILYAQRLQQFGIGERHDAHGPRDRLPRGQVKLHNATGAHPGHYVNWISQRELEELNFLDSTKPFASPIPLHGGGRGENSLSKATPVRSGYIDTIGGRLVLTRATLAGQRFAIVNYHSMADGLHGSPHHTERGGIASETRWRIDEHAKGDPVVMLGDFNAAPTVRLSAGRSS